MARFFLTLFFLGLFLLSSTSVSALDFDPFQARGYLDATLDKTAYFAGETALLNITVQNADSLVFNNGYVVVQLVKETAVFTPNGNVFFPSYFISDKQTPRDLTLGVGAVLSKPFSFELPNWLSEGDYAFYFYFYEGRTRVAGESVQFVPGLIKRFHVSSSSKGEYYVTDLAFVGDYRNQAGPTINSVNVDGHVLLLNNGSLQSGFSLRLSVFKWDDYETEAVSVSEIPIPDFPAFSTLNLSYSIPRPVQANAYSLRFELVQNGEVRSFYHQRFVSPGIGTRIIRLDPSGAVPAASVPLRVGYGIVGSPDGSPVSPFLVAKVYSGTDLLFTQNRSIELFGHDDFWAETLSFIPNQTILQKQLEFAPQGMPLVISLEVFYQGQIIDSFVQTVIPSELKKGVFVSPSLNVLFNSTLPDKMPVMTENSSLAFVSPIDFEGLLCTNSLVSLENSTSYSLYHGPLVNREGNAFALLKNVPEGYYTLKVICFNENDLRHDDLVYSKEVCVGESCLTVEKNPVSKAGFSPGSSTDYFPYLVPIIIFYVILVVYYWHKYKRINR